MSDHQFVHIELSARDAAEAKKFYGKVFGWTFEDQPEQNYTIFSTGDKEVGGGFNPLTEQNPAGTVIVYIGTDDLDASNKAIKANGGTVTLERYEIPNFGVMSMFKDPTGNLLALYQALNR